jgi:hypothetical protein
MRSGAGRRGVGVGVGVAALLAAGAALAQTRAELEVDRVSGSLDRGAAMSAMRDTGNAVQRCLMLAQGAAIASGARYFRVEVDARGVPRVSDAPAPGASAVPAGTPLETRVRGCMRAAIGRVRFPAGGPDASVLAVTVRLSGG